MHMRKIFNNTGKYLFKPFKKLVFLLCIFILTSLSFAAPVYDYSRVGAQTPLFWSHIGKITETDSTGSIVVSGIREGICTKSVWFVILQEVCRIH